MIQIVLNADEARHILCSLIPAEERRIQPETAADELCWPLPEAWAEELGVFRLEAQSGTRAASTTRRAARDGSLDAEAELGVGGYHVVCRAARPELRGKALRVFIGGVPVSGPEGNCPDGTFELDKPTSVRAEVIITIDDVRAAFSRAKRAFSSLDVTVTVVA